MEGRVLEDALAGFTRVARREQRGTNGIHTGTAGVVRGRILLLVIETGRSRTLVCKWYIYLFKSTAEPGICIHHRASNSNYLQAGS
jgi:hypothetical protein